MIRYFRNLSVIAALVAAAIPVFAEEKPQEKPVVTAGDDGIIHLLPDDATLHGKSIRVEKNSDLSHIGHWRDPDDTAVWKIQVETAGRYLVRIETSAEADGAVLILKCSGKLALRVPNSGSLQTYKTSRVGELTLAANNGITLTLKPVVDGWQPVHVRKVELIPLP